MKSLTWNIRLRPTMPESLASPLGQASLFEFSRITGDM